MQESTSEDLPVSKSVAPFSADHGVNPGWGIHEERPAIPSFNGVAEIAKLAVMFTLWSRVESFLYDEVGIQPLSSAKEEKKHRAVLLESETYLTALLCLLNNDHYSAGGLVDAMVGVDASADQRGNARKRILNRTLPIVGDHYGLIDYSERHMGNSMEYSICRSERLVEFAETHLVTSISQMLDLTGNTQKKTASATRKATSAKNKTSTVRAKAMPSDKAIASKAITSKAVASKAVGRKAGSKAVTAADKTRAASSRGTK